MITNDERKAAEILADKLRFEDAEIIRMLIRNCTTPSPAGQGEAMREAPVDVRLENIRHRLQEYGVVWARDGEWLMRELTAALVYINEQAEKASAQPTPSPAGQGEAIRSEVMAFARLMEKVLQDNDHKTGWKECDSDWLFERLRAETKELRGLCDDAAIRSPDKDEREDIARETADVANFAMMIADVTGALDPYHASAQPTPPAEVTEEDLAELLRNDAAAEILLRRFHIIRRK